MVARLYVGRARSRTRMTTEGEARAMPWAPTYLKGDGTRHVDREPSGEVVARDGLAIDDERGVDRAHVGCEEVERLSAHGIGAAEDVASYGETWRGERYRRKGRVASQEECERNGSSGEARGKLGESS